MPPDDPDSRDPVPRATATEARPDGSPAGPPPPTGPAYRGRLAPSPTGHLHLGHARTFRTAESRARASGGTLILRMDDLDAARFRLDYADAALEDLRWLGLAWDEGPDVGGPHAPYAQSGRMDLYRAALGRLHSAGLLYPCARSRRDVIEAAAAPHEGGADDEPVYPESFRPPADAPVPPLDGAPGANWRIRVPYGEVLRFEDGRRGMQEAVVGRDFGDFVVWRKDGVPSYQLACAVDDAAMGITEVVRGDDLIRSTFRQLLIFRGLGHLPPAFYHCPLMSDASGVRLAKRHDALSLRTLRARGERPETICAALDRGDTL